MTKLLSDAELTQMRADLEAYTMPGTCNILSLSIAIDSGYAVETWGTASTGVACRLDHRFGFEQVAGGAVQPFERWILTLPYNTTITEQNRVEIGSDTYSVKAVDPGKSWNVCVRAQVDVL